MSNVNINPDYKLDVFEGPLDLLLHLISKNKLNIYDIPIFTLVEQYTEYISKSIDEGFDIDSASEFLEMAARLLYIKSAALLPVHEEADKLRKELTGELIEYQECKKIAAKLSEMSSGIDSYVREPMEIEADRSYQRVHNVTELLDYYLMAAGKKLRRLPPPVEAFSGIVARRIVSISSKISLIKNLFVKHRKLRLSELYKKSESRSDLVATFLAILELSRQGSIYITDSLDILPVSNAEISDITLLTPGGNDSNEFSTA
ncbi:MAG: segregation/condensation protein A [Clostridiales bacterium]|jgi:segregation and condensation protein A|nr:segregation/condensation protein A [Clostridiales bacterium]